MFCFSSSRTYPSNTNLHRLPANLECIKSQISLTNSNRTLLQNFSAMKEKKKMKPSIIVAAAVTVLVLLLAIYCKLDPLKLSPIYGIKDFKTYKVDMPPWSQIPKLRDPQNHLRNSQIKFRNQILGPESLAFDPQGRGPYTGVADGRVVFWNGSSWSDFAHTSVKYRPELCGLNLTKNEHLCGRPLGLRFHKSGDLYIADAYFGILTVGPKGGWAAPVATQAEGLPFRFTNDLDVDDFGNVYFTDSSSIYQRRDYPLLIYSGVASGRLLRYNPATKQTIVLMRNLVFPNGVSLSKDQMFIVFTEGGRLRRYWLRGKKAETSDVFAVLPGSPDNVRANGNGEFWVAISSFHTRLTLFSAAHPNFRKFTLRLPISAKWQSYIYQMGPPGGIVVKYSAEGELLEILEDRGGKVVIYVSEVQEHDGKLWMGSVVLSHIAVYDPE